MPSTPAIKRYNRRVIVLSVGYAGLLIAANWVFRYHPPHGLTAYLVAALPALPILGIFAAVARLLLEEQDEYVRMLTVREVLVATGLTLSVAAVWGFAEDFGLAPHVPAYHAVILWFAGLGLGACVNKLLEGRDSA